uniref:Pyrin domain-containing protein n=1 Tax=Sus scrofa TaxID=9823 RepID=A0A8D1NVE2_PIG
MGCTRDAILDALENLTADELKKFKMKLLSVPLREGYGRIPRGTLLPLDAIDLTDKLVNYYLEEYSAELTALVLRDIGMKEVAEQLQKTLHKGPGAKPAGIKALPLKADNKPALHFVREGADGRAVPGSAGGAHQPHQNEEALQLHSGLEPDLQGPAPSGPEGHPALPGGRPGAELTRLPQQRPHLQPLVVLANLPGVSDLVYIIYEKPAWSWCFPTSSLEAHAELSYTSSCRRASGEALLSACSRACRLPTPFLSQSRRNPPSFLTWWPLHCHPRGSALKTHSEHKSALQPRPKSQNRSMHKGPGTMEVGRQIYQMIWKQTLLSSWGGGIVKLEQLWGGEGDESNKSTKPQVCPRVPSGTDTSRLPSGLPLPQRGDGLHLAPKTCQPQKQLDGMCANKRK